mmetsp:Transcript_7208/g.9865  ORF Transcript_7208/g.9865 Transcript_7208/m.9865 type:complete len:149 (+) Transcript_7208:62-508(+)
MYVRGRWLLAVLTSVCCITILRQSKVYVTSVSDNGDWSAPPWPSQHAGHDVEGKGFDDAAGPSDENVVQPADEEPTSGIANTMDAPGNAPIEGTMSEEELWPEAPCCKPECDVHLQEGISLFYRMHDRFAPSVQERMLCRQRRDATPA